MLRSIFPWVGGKHTVKNKIIEHFPEKTDYVLYVEPFLGAGSMLLKTQPSYAIVNDMNPWVIMMWHLCTHHSKFVSNKYETLKKKIKTVKQNNEYFNDSRERFNKLNRSLEPLIPSSFCSQDKTCSCSDSLLNVAFDIYYLVKSSFGALIVFRDDGTIRTNFNNKPLVALVNDNYNLVGEYLRSNRIVFTCSDYHRVLQMILSKKMNGNIFVYLDPPYFATEHVNKGYFADNSFGPESQLKLKLMFDRMTSRKYFVLQSNSCHDFIKKLYSDYHVKKIDILRPFSTTSSDLLKNRGTEECVITNYVKQ